MVSAIFQELSRGVASGGQRGSAYLGSNAHPPHTHRLQYRDRRSARANQNIQRAGDFADQPLDDVSVGDAWDERDEHLLKLDDKAIQAVLKEVAAHSSCWAAAGPPMKEGKQAQTTAQRWRQVHDLTDNGVGLLECSRRLGLALNTVKRYARATEPSRMIRAPRYRPTLVDPYRDHLRARRAQDPAVPVHQLLAEIREMGYPGSMNLLYRYITQGRVESDRPHLSPKRVARLLLTRPAALSDSQRSLLAGLTAACPEMTSLATLVSSFAALLRPDPENETRLKDWIQAARACDLPVIHAFTRGLDLDPQAVTAAVTLPYHNGRTEGVNTRTKMIKRQMYGRAGFTLLRHRILLS